MTDKEIRELAEKTRKEKYCKQHQYIEDGYPCCGDCPITYEGYECTDLYSIPFLDGFKAATEYINKIPHFPLKNDSDIERIEKFRDNPELCQTYLRELRDNIECVINGIIAREK